MGNNKKNGLHRTHRDGPHRRLQQACWSVQQVACGRYRCLQQEEPVVADEVQQARPQVEHRVLREVSALQPVTYDYKSEKRHWAYLLCPVSEKLASRQTALETRPFL